MSGYSSAAIQRAPSARSISLSGNLTSRANASRAASSAMPTIVKVVSAKVVHMDLPATVFLLALVPEGGPTDTRMEIPTVDGPQRRRMLVFSSIRTAADFLTRAEQLGRPAKFDYLFRADATRLTADFPESKASPAPSADGLYVEPAPPSP